MNEINKLVEYLKLYDPEFYNYPKEVILIQIDKDGTIHAYTTSDEQSSMYILRIRTEDGLEYTNESFKVKPYKTDSETWSDWTHEVLMTIHGDNNNREINNG